MSEDLNFKYAYEFIEALKNKDIHQIVINQADGKKLIYDRREKTRWIPCSEKLPEKSGYYLCTMTEEHAQHPTGLEICEYDEDIEEFGFWYERFDKTSLGSLGSEWEELYVLAWMPLPELYKAESEVE